MPPSKIKEYEDYMEATDDEVSMELAVKDAFREGLKLEYILILNENPRILIILFFSLPRQNYKA